MARFAADEDQRAAEKEGGGDGNQGLEKERHPWQGDEQVGEEDVLPRSRHRQSRRPPREGRRGAGQAAHVEERGGEDGRPHCRPDNGYDRTRNHAPARPRPSGVLPRFVKGWKCGCECRFAGLTNA